MGINASDTLEFIVVHNGRLDKIASDVSSITRAKIQKLMEDGLVSVNGIVVRKKNYDVHENDIIKICYQETEIPFDLKPYYGFQLDILYEDEYLLVLNKPAGVTTHPGIGNYDNTLVNALIGHTQLSKTGDKWRPGIVHRLDKDTSGLLIIAKNDIVHGKLSDAMKSRQITRKYKALVFGILAKSIDTITTQIGKDKKNHTKMSVVASGGKIAVTHYKVLEVFPKARMSLVECKLETGRTHQIRVHMSHIGHSVVGDQVYGKNDQKLRALFGNNEYVMNFKRQALHSYYLMFDHPITGEKIELEANFPHDIIHLVEKISYYS